MVQNMKGGGGLDKRGKEWGAGREQTNAVWEKTGKEQNRQRDRTWGGGDKPDKERGGRERTAKGRNGKEQD